VTWDSVTDRWDSGQLGSLSGDIHFGDTSGYVYIQDIGATADGSTAIPIIWDSKDYQDELGRLCRWQEMQLWAKGTGALIVEYSTDDGSTWNAMSSSPVTLASTYPSDSAPMMLYFDVVSSKIRIRFRNNTTTDVVEIKQFALGYIPRELRK
jgi:hypothetical protein